MSQSSFPPITPVVQYGLPAGLNSSDVNLAAGATFTGLVQPTLEFNAIQIIVKATIAVGTATLDVFVEQSSDGGLNWDISDKYAYFANRDFGKTVAVISTHVRVRATNTSPLATTAFRLAAILVPIAEPLPRSLDAIGNLQVSAYDHALLLARGLVENNVGFNMLGRNPDVDTGTEDVWPGGGLWVPPTAARILIGVSASALDNGVVPGTGARTIRIEGLDVDWLRIEETLTLNGLTPVNTVNAFRFVSRVTVLAVGSGGANVGLITLTATTDLTLQGTVMAGKNRSQTGIYQVPAGWTAYVLRWGGFVSGAGGPGGNIELELYAGGFDTALALAGAVFISANGGGAERDYETPLAVPEKEYIKLRATAGSNNNDVIAFLGLILVAN